MAFVFYLAENCINGRKNDQISQIQYAVKQYFDDRQGEKRQQGQESILKRNKEHGGCQIIIKKTKGKEKIKHFFHRFAIGTEF